MTELLLNYYTAAPLTVRGMEWDPLPETVCRMAGFLLLQNLHFHRPWWSDTASERTWTPCFYLHGQRVSGDGYQFMSFSFPRSCVVTHIVLKQSQVWVPTQSMGTRATWDALITSKPVSQKHHRLNQRYPNFLILITENHSEIDCLYPVRSECTDWHYADREHV